MFTFVGGIGDFILSISAIRNVIETFGSSEIIGIFFTHYKDMPKLLNQFPEFKNIEKQFFYYSSVSELQNFYANNLENIKRSPKYIGDILEYGIDHYPEIDINEDLILQSQDIIFSAISKDMQKEKYIDVIAVHQTGSEFANSFLSKERNVPNKYIGHNILAEIIKRIHWIRPNTMFVLFGSEKERDIYNFVKEKLPQKCTIHCYNNNLIESLALASQCNLMIGSDSSIKSFTLSQKIPSIIFLGGYDDPERDEKFINPYIKDGLLQTIKFKKEIQEEHIEKMVKMVVSKLGELRQ